MNVELPTAILRAGLVLGIAFIGVPALVCAERRAHVHVYGGSASPLARANGVGFWQFFRDLLKLLGKEEIVPAGAHRALFTLAPIFGVIVGGAAIAAMPFSGVGIVSGQAFSLQVADLPSGLFFALAMLSISSLMPMLAGLSSGGELAMLAGLRVVAQFISLTVILFLAAASVVVIVGSLNLQVIVMDQSSLPWHWNVVRQPIAFLLFAIALLAQLQGSSSGLAGAFREYSSMRFGMLQIASALQRLAVLTLVVIVFFGGWQIPLVSGDAVREQALPIVSIGWPLVSLAMMLAGVHTLVEVWLGRYGGASVRKGLMRSVVLIAIGAGALVVLWYAGEGILQMEALSEWVWLFASSASLFFKILLLWAGTMWVQWSLPSLRSDQFVGICWKALMPLALLNLGVTACVLAA